jgi:hypothetical protein
MTTKSHIIVINGPMRVQVVKKRDCSAIQIYGPIEEGRPDVYNKFADFRIADTTTDEIEVVNFTKLKVGADSVRVRFISINIEEVIDDAELEDDSQETGARPPDKGNDEAGGAFGP